jgi:hypothetical protein
MNCLGKGSVERGSVEPLPVDTLLVVATVIHALTESPLFKCTLTRTERADGHIGLLLDVADPAGPDGHRVFVVDIHEAT